MTKRIIVVGAIGAAYIFGRDHQGRWTQRQKLVPSDAPLAGAQDLSANFGGEVAVDRDMILVGAPGAAVPGASPYRFISGAVYGFVPGGTRYIESFKLHPPLDWSDRDIWLFGRSIAMFGERFAVGSDDPLWAAEHMAAGYVHTYMRAGTGAMPLGATPVLQGQGASIAIDNNRLVIGTPRAGLCLFESECPGEVEVYDLNYFEP